MSTATVQGKSTFAFDRTIRNARQRLKKTENYSQIPHLPATYPQRQNSLNGVDVTVRAKILKCHLEDTYPQNIFSVAITRRKEYCTITVCHDFARSETIAGIAALYENDSTRIVLDTFASNSCEQ